MRRRVLGLSFTALAVALGATAACSSSNIADDVAMLDGGDDADASSVDGASHDAGGDVVTGDTGSDGGSVALRGGAAFLCVSHAGVLRCWGENAFGQLGRGTATPYESNPAPVVGLGTASDVFALGYRHACAVAGGALSCWGDNYENQLGHPSDVELDAGDASTCNTLPCRTSPVAVPSVVTTSELAFGFFSGCARASSGAVICWGYNFYGEVGSDAGTPQGPYPTGVPDLTGTVQIAFGGDTGCARKQDGTIWCWGANYDGTLGVTLVDGGPDASGADYGYHPSPVEVPGITGATYVAVGTYHACAVTAQSTVVCWGSSVGGTSGHDPSLDPMCATGTCRATPQEVAGLTDVKEISLGAVHSCALKKDETVVCWGANLSGELGHAPLPDAGTLAGEATPSPVQGLTGVAHLAAGFDYSCAVKHDGTVLCWGANESGQLARDPNDGGPDGGALLNSATPLVIPNL